ncbi:MAG: hypothetical protein JW928_04610, partial [Candidatus Aureabacteria bacterium]|nr:hypothetical protein [Candidatus Auribacterota bacterium]
DSFVLKFAENFPYKETRSLTSWIDHYTDKDSVFLANFPLTGSILAYGGRSVVTHPKYEDEDSRKIIRDYISSLFEEGEESFYRFCFENGVDFFVFSKGTYADRTVYSYRYVAGMEKPLPDREKSPAFLFENSPYRLRYFGLCFENEKYRVFRVITEESIKRSSALFREAMQIFQEDGSSVEGLNVLYGAFLENPQSLAVRILLRGKKKKMKSLLPHVD